MALNFQPSGEKDDAIGELKRESINKAMDFLGPQRKQTISSESLEKAQIQLLHDKTSSIQATSESKIGPDEAEERKRMKDHSVSEGATQREDAIQRIQAAQRGIDCRLLASEQQKEGAATKISLERGRQCQQLVTEQEKQQKQKQNEAIMRIQGAQRGLEYRSLLHTEISSSQKEDPTPGPSPLTYEQQEREDAALKIQKVQRGKVGRHQISEKHISHQQKKDAATKIQAVERGRQCRQQLTTEQREKQQQEDAAIKIQKVQRGNASRKLDQEKEHAATKIQSLQRGRKCRQQFAAEQLEKQQQEEAAIKIQKLQRGKACRQQVSVERQQKEAAARRIQSLERGRQCRQQLAEDKRRQKEDAAAVKIQRIQLGNASRKQDQRKQEAATRLQSLERGRQCRQQLAQEKKKKQAQEDAAVKIQKIQRGKVARKVAETERELRRKEEKAKRLCFPKRGGTIVTTAREVPQKTGKSSRLRTYQLCHAEAKRQAQPKGPSVQPEPGSKSTRSVTPAGRNRNMLSGVSGVSGQNRQNSRSMTPGRLATKPPAKAPFTQIPKSSPPVAASQSGGISSRSTTPGRNTSVKATQPRPFNSGKPAVPENLLGRRVAAKLTEKRLEAQQSKKELAEKETTRVAADIIQACLKSYLSRKQLEILHQQHVNAMKIQALFRGWRGRRLFRSRLKAKRALQDFDQQVQRSSIIHRLKMDEMETQTSKPTTPVAKGVQRGAQEKKSASPVSPGTTPTTPSPGYRQLHRGKAPAGTTGSTTDTLGTPKKTTRASSKSAARRWM